MNRRVLLFLSLFTGSSCSYLAFIGMTPLDPTPTGMWSNIAWASCSFTGWTSLSSKLVLNKRTPQLMSNPTPPTKQRKISQILAKLGIGHCYLWFPTISLIDSHCFNGNCFTVANKAVLWGVEADAPKQFKVNRHTNGALWARQAAMNNGSI